MEPRPRSFNSLDCFSYTSISIYGLLFLPMAPKTCCGKTQPFSLILSSNIRGILHKSYTSLSNPVQSPI